MTWLDGSKTFFNSSRLFFLARLSKGGIILQVWAQIPQTGQIYDFRRHGLFKFLQSCG